MSIATEISRIQQAKADIKSSIEAKGVTVPSAALIDDYSDYVDAIQTGGGGDDSMEHYLNNTLTSYTIPAGVTSLHNYCFSHLSNLKSLTLNNDLTTIGENAFEYTGIENITIPSNVTNVKVKAFYYSDLKSITFKGDITLGTEGSQNADVFDNCRKLEKIRYEGNVTPLGQLFGSSGEYITGLETAGPLNGDYSIEYGFADLPQRFLYGLYWLKYITFNTGITTINNYAIYQNYRLKELVFPSTLTTINGPQLGYMHCLKELEFKSVTPPSWQNYSNYYVTLFDIIVPDESVEAYKTTFPNAANRIFAANNKPTYHQTTQLRYSSQTGTTPFTESSETVLTTSNTIHTNLKVVYLGDSVTELKSNVFNNNSIEQIWISPNNSIEILGDYTLAYCYNDIVLPNIRTIGNNVFSNLYTDSLTFGNNLTSIGNNCISYSPIKNLVIPDSVTSIGDNFLSSCREIRNLTLGKNLTRVGRSFINTSFYTGEEHDFNVNIRCTNVPSQLLYNKNIVTSIVLENTVETIGDSAFYFLTKITTLNIPSSVTSIGTRAFNGCNHLTSITVNATTPPTLGTGAFESTNSCPIYVPAASVDTYKAATGWSSLASRIQAIPSE